MLGDIEVFLVLKSVMTDKCTFLSRFFAILAPSLVNVFGQKYFKSASLTVYVINKIKFFGINCKLNPTLCKR